MKTYRTTNDSIVFAIKDTSASLAFSLHHERGRIYIKMESQAYVDDTTLYAENGVAFNADSTKDLATHFRMMANTLDDWNKE